ncbi:DNA helicase UvrBC [Candidatus Poribacteria bacterium]|nr:DNA helicase UvrBC [Candidatus Poribacteria bacterium]
MAKASLNRDDLTIEALDQILDAIGYDSDTQVRVLRRDDGREVLIVQANRFSVTRLYVTGRPDGRLIDGFESLHALVRHRLEEFKSEHETDAGFSLEPATWRRLFAESADRYVRYLFCSGIHRWGDVERDTRTNLDTCDLARRYADDELAWGIYQYKGYILMMNTIARAELALEGGAIQDVGKVLMEGIDKIGGFCRECLLSGHPEAEATTREHYLSNLLRYREGLIHDGRLPDAAREDPRNVV